jgi:hypothetical protein
MSDPIPAIETIQNPLIARIVGFIQSIGLTVRLGTIPQSTFLPGVTVQNGILIIDKERLLYPGDPMETGTTTCSRWTNARCNASGYRLCADGKHLEADPGEQAVLDEIRRMRQSGHTLRGIAAALNHRGHRTRRGSTWRLEHVARIAKHGAVVR